MHYKSLGGTGLNVSALALGTMTFGDGADQDASREIYKRARDAGINVFDCANVYGEGASESILGALSKDHRSAVILASKAFYPMNSNPEDRGLGKAHLADALSGTLSRLQTDYLDIFYLHAFDPLVPLEETFEVLNEFHRSGRIRHIGVSNFAAWQIMKAQKIAGEIGGQKIEIIQPMHNLFKRQAETELLPMATSEQLGVFTYSPLAGGLLTGKYQESKRSSGRLIESPMYKNRYDSRNTETQIELFLRLAHQHDLDPVHLAIAWSANHPAITAPLIGARTPEQLSRALGGIDVTITAGIQNALDQIFPPSPLATDREEERR